MSHISDRVIESYEAKFETVGFNRPTPIHVKHDPRGSEYGEFRVSIEGNNDIMVEKFVNDICEYSIHFRTINDFVCWARDT